MYNAPAVSYPVGRSRFHAGLLAAILAAGVSSLAVWVMQSDHAGSRHLAATGLWLVTASVAIWAWLRTPAGQLTWDTKAWLWTSSETARQANVSAVLDSQIVLLLYLRLPAQLPIWLWVEQRTAPTRWLALRRAVFAHRPAASTPDADGVTS